MEFIKFESVRDKEQARKELREAREQMLENARLKAESRAKREEQNLLSGKSTWMLPTVVSKIEKRSKDQGSHKKIKKKKKSKKSKSAKKSGHKKRKRKHSNSSDSEDSESDSSADEKHRKRVKKSKKKKSHRNRSSSESSSASSDSERSSQHTEKDDWIEKPSVEPPLKRDDWMMDSVAFSLKTFTKERKEVDKKEVKQLDAYDPASNVRELNPHWKLTGTGLPAFRKPKDDSDNEQSGTGLISKSYTSTNNWRKKLPHQEQEHSNQTKRPSEDSYSSESSEPESSSRVDTKEVTSTNDFLTDQQLTELSAKILKAEILGNTEIVEELKAKLERARLQRSQVKVQKNNNDSNQRTHMSRKRTEEHVLLTRTDELGNCRPLKNESKKPFDPRDMYGPRNPRKKSAKRIETHENGERMRFFPDDDKYDIKQMFEAEKGATAAQSNLQFADIVSKQKNSKDDLDDIFADKIRTVSQKDDLDKKELQRAIRDHERLSEKLDNCDKCLDSQKINKSLIISMAEKVYLALPWHIGLQMGHCVIVPTQHASCGTLLDEDAWEEVQNFCKALTRMFAAQKKDVIFFEIANKLHRRPHMTIHCVPIPMDQGESAPFYFKKAIEESEHEWSVNKQLVSLRREKGLRSCIPKGLPYFWVQFGTDYGFAHVIEDQDRFPSNFALEIIGGMLNLNPSKWRKPQKEENFISRVKSFADWWKKYDFT